MIDECCFVVVLREKFAGNDLTVKMKDVDESRKTLKEFIVDAELMDKFLFGLIVLFCFYRSDPFLLISV